MKIDFDSDRLRWGLRELGSREEQELVWLGNAPGQMSSFEEASCRVFDDSRLEWYWNSEEFLQKYGREIVYRVGLLLWLLLKVPRNAYPSAIISLPVMDEVRENAAWLLKSELCDPQR